MGMTDDIDQADLRILRAVQANGRLSIAELSEQVGLSKTPCLKRLRRLEEQGYITHYKAVLNASKLHRDYTAFVQVKLASTTRRDMDAFSAAAKAIPQVQSCHMMSGGFDFLLKIQTRDMKTYRELLGDVISELPCIAHTSSYTVMETVKDVDHVVI